MGVEMLYGSDLTEDERRFVLPLLHEGLSPYSTVNRLLSITGRRPLLAD